MSATKLQFTKMQGLGNDYVYVDCTKKKLENASEVAGKSATGISESVRTG